MQDGRQSEAVFTVPMDAVCLGQPELEDMHPCTIMAVLERRNHQCKAASSSNRVSSMGFGQACSYRQHKCYNVRGSPASVTSSGKILLLDYRALPELGLWQLSSCVRRSKTVLTDATEKAFSGIVQGQRDTAANRPPRSIHHESRADQAITEIAADRLKRQYPQ